MASSSSSSSRGKCRLVSLDEIDEATDGFDESNILGQGGEGKVYLAKMNLGCHTQVAVKFLKPNSQEVDKEIQIISKIQHPNLVSLLGYCDESGQKILLYEFMEKGSLSDYVRKKSEISVPWLQRLRICLDAARGLQHLHLETDEFPKGIIHRDVKPDNILLDKDWVAKVSDFGMFKLSVAGQLNSTMITNLKGTGGYYAPEYVTYRSISRKIDVYAFGVVLFQVLCLKMPWDRGDESYYPTPEEDFGVWARENIDTKIKEEILDDSLKGFTAIIGKTLKQDPRKRPTMDDVVLELEKVLKFQEREDEAKKAREANLHSPAGGSLLGASSEASKTIAEGEYNKAIVIDTGGGMTKNATDGLIPRVINGLVDVIVKECTYVYKFQSNVQNVQAKVAELRSVEGDVDLEVNEASWRGKVAGIHIKRWKDEVAMIMDKSDKVLKGADKVNSRFLTGRLNVCRRFLLSRKAAQLISDMANVLVEGQKHIKLDYGAVPAGLLPAAAIIHSDDLESRMKLTNKVMVALQNERIFMIGICGMAGVGKTWLADEVTRRVLEEKLFDAAVKVKVSDDPNIPAIQSAIAQHLGLKLDETDEEGRARKLRCRLTDGSKNLVILDHIWDAVPLYRVGLPSQGEERGCKVVFTSQYTDMPRRMKADVKVEVKPLSIYEARLLFKKIAGEYVEDLANRVADECGGIPLVIDAVATALGGRPPEIWESALDQLRESNETKEFEMDKLVYSRIKLSFTLLGKDHPKAQPLLLLCCLFPEEADIPNQKLVRYAKGLQLLNASDNLVNTSIRVFKLLDDLKNFSLVLRGEKETTVKMNRVVRDVCLSFSSEEDNIRIKVIHKPKLVQWLNEEKHQPYISISLMFGDQMQQLPDGLVYPQLVVLQMQFHCDSLDMPVDFFNGMKEVRVLDIKRVTGWGKFMQIDGLAETLQFLTNLRTLCIEFCDLSGGDLSLIESLKNLEILSFFSSKLVNLPSQMQQLTNLKLLDLRCAGDPQFIPSNILPALTKLEDLYLGNFDSWSRGMEQSVPGQGANITELSSLSLLRVLQVRVKYPQLLLELKVDSWFKGLRRFQIAAIQEKQSFSEYDIGRSITFDRMDWRALEDAQISSLMSTTECLTLKATSFKNLFSVCSNLQTLDLDGGDNVKFIMEAGDSADTLNKLKRMEIKCMDDLKAICNGDLPLKSLTNLETVKLDNLPGLIHLWRAPMGSECLGNLRVLDICYCESITCIFPFSVAKGLVQLEKLDIKGCEMLEWIVSKGEGEAAEQIVLEKLSSILLYNLPNFRSFSPDSGVKTLTDEISATEEENPFAANHKRKDSGWFTRKKQAPGTKALPPTLHFKHESATVLSEDNVKCTSEPLFNPLVELPSMNKLLVGSMHNVEHIVNDQTSELSVSKIRIMHVVGCEKLLSLAASEYSIRSLQNLEQVNVENCESMEAMFEFGIHNVENASADPILNKLETVTLLNLKNLNHVFRMVPEGTPCFKNLRSLVISGCDSLSYVFSISAAKMLENLQDLKVKGSAMVEEIFEIEGGHRKVTDTIKFSCLRVLELDNLHRLTSISSGNHDFQFPQLEDLLIRECPRMNKFCRGQVKSGKLDRVRVGEHHDQWVSIKNGLNITIGQLNGDRDWLLQRLKKYE